MIDNLYDLIAFKKVKLTVPLFGGDDNDQLVGDATDLDVADHNDDFLGQWSEAA